MTTVKITDATVEPVTLAEVKLQLRIEVGDTSLDSRINSYITAARQECEHLTQRTMIETLWELVRDGFPTALRLERPKVRSVSSVKYIDEAGIEQTLNPSDYLLDADSEPSYVVPAYGKAWPATRCQVNSVRVRYVAGFAVTGDGDATAQQAKVPRALREWIILRVTQMHEGCAQDRAEFMRTSALLDDWRVYS